MVVRTHIKAGIHPMFYNIDCNEKKEYIDENGDTVLSGLCLNSEGLMAPSSIIVPKGFTGEILNCDGILSLDTC